MDKKLDKKVETARYRHVTFTIGLNPPDIELLLTRVNDAQARFKSSPLASIASDLEKKVIVQSVFGTNTIEQGTLSEDEIRVAFNKSPDEIQTEQEQRVVNIRNAYDQIKALAKKDDWQPTVEDVRQIHVCIYDKLHSESGKLVSSGVLRDNPKEQITIVGNADHGGTYKPPQYGDDVRLLLGALLDWNKILFEKGIPALIRAPLLHYYFELIHPFADGNGRVGRVLEAGVLYADGFRYAPFAQASYYLKNIHKYFALFNECRKLADKKRDFSNHTFIEFFLQGMLESINNLHDRVNKMTAFVIFHAKLKHDLIEKKINQRQYTIVNKIFDIGTVISTEELKREIWYIDLYANLSSKTMSRDLEKLLGMDILSQDEGKKLRIVF